MCPSYMATRDERHSTRGRANALRLAITNQIGEEGWFREEVHDALDLCLGCKACKKECPNAVDVARLKSEVWNSAGYGSRVFGRIDELAPLASRFAGLVNALGRLRITRFLLRKLAGLDPRRPLPAFARQRFSTWAARQKPAGR
ncbi:MAG: 4Fe-4S dicluster domain-containing protein, partial [Kiritimatiellia bacterium]